MGALAYPLLTRELFEGTAALANQVMRTPAGSGTIEGWLILRPEFTTPDVVVKAMSEGFVQGLALSAGVARWILSLPGAATGQLATAGAGGSTVP